MWEENPRMVAKLSGYELQQRLLVEQQPVIPWHFQSLPVILQGGAGLPIKTLIWQIFGRFWICALKYLHQRFRPKMRIWLCIHTTLILIRPRWFPYIHGSHCGLIPPQKKCENISTFIQVFLWIMKMFPDLEEEKNVHGFPWGFILSKLLVDLLVSSKYRKNRRKKQLYEKS